jgi:hypothetical protein
MILIRSLKSDKLVTLLHIKVSECVRLYSNVINIFPEAENLKVHK